MSIVSELKQLQRQFTGFSQNLELKPTKTGAHGSTSKSADKNDIIEIQKNMEGIWIKAERVNTEMIRTFSQLDRKSVV